MDAVRRRELEELTARMCKALNDPKRLMLLYALGHGDKAVSELCEEFGLSQSNVSQHLGVLRDRGLVEARRDGSYMIYRLRHPKVLAAIDLLREIMADELLRQDALGADIAGA